MELGSVLSTGVQGVRTGLQTAENAAQTIASAGASDTSGNQNTGSEAVTSQAAQAGGLDALTEAIVDLTVGERQVEASAAVIRTADQMLGAVIDIKA